MQSKRLLRSVSYAQSSVDGLQPAGHRLDLLITEQRTLVKSTQESLQKALSQFKTSNSKEEQESARMQIQSLLSRAQELVITVQVILHIRSEIGHTQLEIRNAKARHEPTSKLHGRLQWLEQHLEKMLMARRRGRPGAHGGRRFQTQAPVAPIRAVRGRPVREPMSIETTSRGDNISDFDRESSWRSNESLGTSNVRNVHSLGSKHSGSRDSDAWHSESEANWTMVEVNSNQPKDITQSQVLSEDEPKHNQLGYTPSWSVPTEHSLSPNLQVPGEKNYHALPTHYERDLSSTNSCSEEKTTSGMSTYNFEPRRSLEVFGDCSWNSLSLATNSNFVRSASGMMQDVLGLSMSMLHAGVSDITKDIESLKKLIVNAGQAAVGSGPMVSVNKTAVRFVLSSRERSATRRSRKVLGEQGRPPPTLEPSGVSSSDNVVLECSKLSPSKKQYGNQVVRNRSSTYPRATSIWCESTPLDYETSPQPPPLPRSVPGSAALQRLRSASKSPSSRRKPSRRSRTISGEGYFREKDDIFDKEKHQERCIKELLHQMTSPVTDVRKSSVQALGLLKSEAIKNEEVAQELQEIMLSDKTALVQYEALKSLLALGVVNVEVISFARHCLRGSPDLSFDLLSFLAQDHILQHISKKNDDVQLSLIEALRSDLLKMLKSGQPQSGLFLVVVLLSQVGLDKEMCVQLLKETLSSSSEQESQALCCLVRCWQCFDTVICSALKQMEELCNWKLRQRAIECLIESDKKVLILSSNGKGRNIYDVLLQRLPNEPILAVRVTIGKLLIHLGLHTKAENALIGRLDSGSEVVRAEAVTAMSAFGSPSAKNVRVLVECLNLDPSNYVRVQVAKLFSVIWHHSPLILNQLIAKSRGTGPVAQECSAILQGIYQKS